MTTATLRPRMVFTKVARRLVSRFPSVQGRHFVRDHLRKWCVDEELPVNTRWGFKIGASPHDYASAGIFFGDYDPEMTGVMQHAIRPGQQVWDLGTERGWFTLLMGRLVGPAGRVDAFEAFPTNAAKVEANCRANGFSWFHVHAQAVSDRPGFASFVPPSDAVTRHVAFLNHCSGVGYLTETPGDQQPADALGVPTITLDQFAQENNVQALHFVKMDIEGAEHKALLGGMNTIRRHRPILAVEYNRLTARRADTSVQAIHALIQSWGYDQLVFQRRFESFDLDHFDRLPDEAAVVNVYCFPR